MISSALTSFNYMKSRIVGTDPVDWIITKNASINVFVCEIFRSALILRHLVVCRNFLSYEKVPPHTSLAWARYQQHTNRHTNRHRLRIRLALAGVTQHTLKKFRTQIWRTETSGMMFILRLNVPANRTSKSNSGSKLFIIPRFQFLH